MDATYDAGAIKEVVEHLGRVPIIDPNGPKVELPDHRLERFKNRSSVERVNGNLKDNFDGRSIRVKGAAKVMCNFMFGLIALTAAQLYRAFCSLIAACESNLVETLENMLWKDFD